MTQPESAFSIRLVATTCPSLDTVHSPSQKSNWRLSGRESQGNSAVAASESAHAAAAARTLFPRISLLERREVELLHLHHRREGALEARRLRFLDHLHPLGGHDLPGDPVLVLEPAARLRPGVAALAELFPVVVHFSLVLAVH